MKYEINERFTFLGDSTGTALHKSIIDSQLKFATMLLENGAKVNRNINYSYFNSPNE